MGLETLFHPEQYPGYLENFGWFKVQRHTKSVLVNILTTFFDASTQMYKLQIPEIVEVQNSSAIKKIFIERDFPFFERKLPLIAIEITGANERKIYNGADNWAGIKYAKSSTGEIISAYDRFVGMTDITTNMIIAATSPEERMQLSELINICFTHYYRWQYYYYDEDGSMFTIVPATKPLNFGDESEVSDESKTNLIYVTTVKMESIVEYNFVNMVPDDRYMKINYTAMDDSSGPVEDA